MNMSTSIEQFTTFVRDPELKPLHARGDINVQFRKAKHYKQILSHFNLYILDQVTKKGTPFAYNTRFGFISMLKTFLEETEFTLETFSSVTVGEFLEGKKQQANYINVLKKFSLFLWHQHLLSESEYIKISQLKATVQPKKFVPPGQEKKFVIPKSRWTEIFNHPKILNMNTKRLICFLGLNFGIRPNEICNLKLQDLYLEAEIPFIQIQPHPEENYQVKTRHGIRRIPLRPEQVLELHIFLKFRLSYLEAYDQDHDFVCYNDEAEPITVKTLTTWIRVIYLDFIEYGKTITRKISPYIFRYSSAWYHYNRKKDLYGVSKLLGHKSVRTTEKYLGLSEQQKFDALAEMLLD